MIGLAVGQMGLSLESFLRLTPIQFDLAYERFNERIEADDIQAERRARLTVFRTVCPPKGKELSVYDFWPIKGDAEIKAAAKRSKKPSTNKKFEELKRKWQ